MDRDLEIESLERSIKTLEAENGRLKEDLKAELANKYPALGCDCERLFAENEELTDRLLRFRAVLEETAKALIDGSPDRIYEAMARIEEIKNA